MSRKRKTLGLAVVADDMNGCHFVFTPNGEVHVKCPASPIRVTTPLCTITVHPQTVNSVDYVSKGEGATRTVAFDVTAAGIVHTQSSLCSGGSGSFSNGAFSGSIATTCADTVENHVGCWRSTE